MEITFENIKSKEIINIYDGKKLGFASDITFDKGTGKVLGISVPGTKRIFKKAEIIFIPIDNVKKIGEDVLLVKIAPEMNSYDSSKTSEGVVYARYKKVREKEK